MQANAFFIDGPVGKLEAVMSAPFADDQRRPIVSIICHPNPTEGGTMNNKVVTTIARAFENLGLITVRFNYRGVGQSDGAYGDVVGEIQDLKAVMTWAQATYPADAIWLAGFSFGSFISASVANESGDVARLVNIAPAADRHDFSRLTQVQCPWLVVASDADEVVALESIKLWLDGSPLPIDLVLVEGASHFFHGRLIELRERLIERLRIAT